MVLSVHAHLSTTRRHPSTVALPASSSGTLEPRFEAFDAPPSFPWSPINPLFHATHKMQYIAEGLRDTVAYQGYLRVSERCYLLPIRGTDTGLPGDGPLGAKLGQSRFDCFFQSPCGWGACTQYSQGSGTRCRCVFSGSLEPWHYREDYTGERVRSGPGQSSIHHNISIAFVG